MKHAPLHPLVSIVWRDCTHISEVAMTREEVEAETLIEMQTAGHLICEREDAIAIGQDWVDETQRYRHVTWVPRVNIVKMYKYKR